MKTSGAATTRIFLDVDGVLNSFPVPRVRYALERRRTVHAWRFVLHVRPAILAALLRIAARRDAEIVWLSTWSHHCTEDLEPALGMTQTLPVIPMPDDSHNRLAEDPERWWKAIAVREWLDANPDRRAIWIDDDLAAPLTHARFAEDYPDQLTMIAPIFSKGLTRAHLRSIARLTAPRRATILANADAPTEDATPAEDSASPEDTASRGDTASIEDTAPIEDTRAS